MAGYYTINDDGSINRPGNFNRPPKPDSNLIWSIICISICLPFGLLALIESVKVDSLYSNGEYDEARRASENSKKWSIRHQLDEPTSSCRIECGNFQN